MPTRNGSAVWEGTLREGKGTVKLGSGAYEGPYSFASRFEDGNGTNPEELIGAAHAGCFSMALAAGWMVGAMVGSTPMVSCTLVAASIPSSSLPWSSSAVVEPSRPALWITPWA